MKISIGILVAPRPEPTYQKAVRSLDSTGIAPILFCEPGCNIDRNEYMFVQRPATISTERMPSSPDGVFNNFSNWIQAGRDLLEIANDADTFLIAEDDALFAYGIRSLLERDLWPSADCGAVSLYCPDMVQYSKNVGLSKVNVVRERVVTGRNNMVGALALVFPRNVLEKLVYREDSIAKWKGSHDQASKETPPWERKAVDTWIGRTLVEMGKTIWSYNPSLVLHYSPFLPEMKKSNSSLGHGVPVKRPGIRQARSFVGEDAGDLRLIYPPVINES